MRQIRSWPLALLILATACTPLPTATVAAPSHTPTPAETATPAPTPTPEPPKELTTEDLQAGRWGDYTFSKNASGYYAASDASGNLIPDLRLFEDGTAELDYPADGKPNTLTIAFQALSVQEERLIAGLWAYQDGQWSMQIHAAPKDDEETMVWRSLAIIRGHPKETAMVSTIFSVRDLAMRKTESYDPAQEFEDLPPITVNFKTIENFDPRPRRWEFSNFHGIRACNNWLNPISRNPSVIYEDTSRLAFARPLQVALRQGWFNIAVLNKDTNWQPTIVHVPVILEDTDGSLVHASALIRQADISRIAYLLSKAERGKLGLWLYDCPAENSFLVGDLQLVGFASDVNRDFFATSTVPARHKTIELPSLPSHIGTVFFNFMARPEDLSN